MSILTFSAAQILQAAPRRRISEAMGKIAKVRWSQELGERVIGTYCNLYNVDLSDCAQKEGWHSFDAFFTRSLKADARPQAAGLGVLTSPADGRLDVVAQVDASSEFPVKGQRYSVSELLGSQQEAETYQGGTALVVYLSPRDYHRVHFPASGALTSVRSLPGDFYPVNAIGIRHIKNLFSRNRRVVFSTRVDLGDGTLRNIAIVMVAAIVVGRISSVFVPGDDVALGEHIIGKPGVGKAVSAGDELGIFHLGSTAVVLVEKGAVSNVAERGPIRMGERLMTLKGGPA
jgi:phosphatidylserine decarboxylase